jgi:hypothetical protein
MCGLMRVTGESADAGPRTWMLGEEEDREGNEGDENECSADKDSGAMTVVNKKIGLARLGEKDGVFVEVAHHSLEQVTLIPSHPSRLRLRLCL